ncbi:MAG: plastocyanin/azurin family copper-binding protein, partial [bacterium]
EGLLEHDFNVMGIRASGVKAVDVGVSSAHGSAHGSAPEAVHVAAGPGKTGTLTFTPLVAGEFPVACSVPGHKEAGMVGTLTVTSE